MSEMNLTSKVNEDSMDRASDGVPHSPSTGNTGGDSSNERSPWDKFLAKLRSVRLVRSAKKLRDLRDTAQAWYPAVEAEQQDIQERLDAATDTLDQAAFKEELEMVSVKVTKLNDGFAAISERAEALVGDSGA